MDKPIVVCPGELDITHAQRFRSQLMKVAAHGAVSIDASAVVRADASGVQLLVAFVLHVQNSGGSWSWLGASDALLRATKALGLIQILRLEAKQEPAS